jgi:hypothetical protein
MLDFAESVDAISASVDTISASVYTTAASVYTTAASVYTIAASVYTIAASVYTIAASVYTISASVDGFICRMFMFDAPCVMVLWVAVCGLAFEAALWQTPQYTQVPLAQKACIPG